MRPWPRSRVRSPHGDAVPGQGGAAVQQGGLVGLDHQQVVGLLAGDQELGGLVVGVERVGGDHHAGQVQGRQQRGEGGDLLGRAADLALGQHRAAGVVHRRQQVHRAAVTAGARAPRSVLPSTATARRRLAAGTGTRSLVGQPGADRAGQRVGVQAGKGPADGGLGRDGEVAGGVRGGRRARPGPAGARRRPTRRSRRSTGPRPAPRRPPGPGWRPAGGGGHGQLAGRGRWPGRPAGAGLRRRGVGGDRRG